VVLIDLSEVLIERQHGSLVACLRSTGQLLFQRIVEPDRPVRAQVGDLLDDALGSARLFLAGRWLHIAWYNPATARIAVGPAATGRVMWAHGPIAIEPSGTIAILHHRTGELHVAGKVAHDDEPDPDTLRLAALHHEELRHHVNDVGSLRAR
jgi:hypothetical protein